MKKIYIIFNKKVGVLNVQRCKNRDKEFPDIFGI